MDPRLCILGLGEMIDGVVGVTKVVVRCKKMNSAEMASREAPLGKRLGQYSHRNNMEGENSLHKEKKF